MQSAGNISVFDNTFREMSGISDEALLIFTWIVCGAVCLAIDVFGIVTNIINIICFVKQGFQDSVTISLLSLSVSDLLSLITMCLGNIGMTPAVTAADLPFDSMEVSYLVVGTPHVSFSRVTSWITALIALERCLCVIAPLKIKSIFTPGRTGIVIICMCIALLFSSTPIYLVNKLGVKFSPLRNKTTFGLVYTGNREQVQKVNFIINNFSLPLAAFFVIVICTVTLVIKLQSSTEWRKKSMASSQADRVSTRNQRVAKMTVMISTLFIVCFIPLCIVLLSLSFEPELSFGGKFLKIGIIIIGLGFILESINSSANIFIYYHMSSRYREIFRKIFRLENTEEKHKKNNLPMKGHNHRK